jgi:hypothetical protein
MKKNLIITILLFSFSSMLTSVSAQELGATFCWQDKEMEGGHFYRYNQSIVKSTIVEKEWWENQVEEVDYAGLDYIALLSRGTTPGRADRGMGDPNHIPLLIDAMNTRGVNSFKLAIFDDCPNSWTSGLNYDLTGSTAQTYKFDVGDPNNYKYIWDYNLKIAIEKIPDERRYKIDGRMVIIFWSIKDTWMTNMGNGNIEKILQHIRTQCFATYGFYPYLVAMRSWFDRDATLMSSTSIDAVHDWFSSANNYSHTNYSWTHRVTRQVIKTGCCVPGFSAPDDPDGRKFLDPSMGTTDKGLRLKTGLNNTVKAGAALTLVEGFTDAAEHAALWRSTDNGKYSYYEYPSQRLNILRSFSRNPYPASLKMEAESCDDYSDLTVGNSGGTYLQMGDLDVAKCTDLRTGWHVTGTQTGEWLQWREIPLLPATKFQLRYKSTAVSSVKMSVDGNVIATTSLPSTGGAWSTIDIGNYTTAANSVHNVRLNIEAGSPDINYLTRITTPTNAVSSVSISPAAFTIEKDANYQFAATILPSNADNKTVNWVSENAKVAIVNSEGLVTATGPGSTKIWAITNDGEKTASVLITVPGVIYLDDCDVLSGWTSSQTLTLYTANEMQGSACIEFTGSTLDEFKKVFSPAYNSGTTLANSALRFWYYVSDVTKCGPIRVELGSAGRADVNEYSWQLTGLTNGWNQINLRMNTSTKVGTLDLSAINWFRIYDSKSGSITTRIDGIEVYNADANAVKELKFNEMEVSIYPNPVQNQLNLKFSNSNFETIDLQMFDASGRTVMKLADISSKGSEYQVDVSKMNNGIYLLKLNTAGKTLTKRILVNR